MRKLLDAFSVYLETERGASRNTRESYLRDLKSLADFLEKKGICEMEQISPKELRIYLEELTAEGLCAATVSRNAASIRAFFSWLFKTGRLISDPSQVLHAPKVVKQTPVILNEAEVERLLAAPSLKTAKGLRDRAMLELLYATGLRVSELCGLRLSDADHRRRMLVISGSSTRIVPYDKRSARWLEKYLRSARKELGPDCGALFVSCRGEAMSRQGFWKLLKKYGRDAGLGTELTPHVLRHSFAVHALQNGTDANRLSGILGHSAAAAAVGYMEIYKGEIVYEESKSGGLCQKRPGLSGEGYFVP